MDNYKYDVALSFAGEQRKYAQNIAQRLSDCGLKVYMDKWNISMTWGKEFTSFFKSVYMKEAMYVIAIFSKEYCEKKWTQFEFKMIQSRQKHEEEFILPIVIDGTFPQNWPKTRGYIDANDYSIDDIVLMVRDKVLSRRTKSPEHRIENNIDFSPKHMTIIGENGETEVVEVICAFEFKDTKKEYVVYSKNEIDDNGNVTVYVSYIDRSENNPKLFCVDDSDWWRVKEVLWELAQDESMKGVKMPVTPFFDKDGMEIL